MNRTTINAIATAIQARQPVILVGPPGGGKTEIVGGICRALELPYRPIYVAMHSTEDIGGFPAPDFDRGLVRMMPNESLFAGLQENHVLFWDEYNHGDAHKQGASQSVIQKNHAGIYKLPKGVRHVLAINPPDQSAGGVDIEPPPANRLMWIDFKTDTKVWGENALRAIADANGDVHFPTPEVVRVPDDWYALIGPQLTLTVAYTRARQDVLHAYPKTHAEACGAWRSPRSWTSVAKIDAAIQAAGLDDDVRLMCFGGLIGHNNAIEYLTYLRELDLPDTETLLHAPAKFKLPQRGDQRYAVLAGVTGAVVRHFTDERYHAAWKIFDTARAGGAGDIAVASATGLAAMHKHLKGPGPRKEMEAFLPLLKKTGLIPA